MDDLPTFRLFDDPVREGSFERTEEACEVCGTPRGWTFAFMAYTMSDEPPEIVCPWCIADGSAAATGLTFNDPTVYSGADDTPSLPADDAKEVEERTPGFETWQDHGWMACCGKACRYLGEADADDLRGRWAEAVDSILEDVRGSWSAADQAELIAGIRKRVGPSAYVFECVECGRLRGFWDSH